ncbi:MAG: hypothetical protein V2I43_17180 [Parvularcula sp.]|nr:hypothetical protein [Parvularcula sp.]
MAKYVGGEFCACFIRRDIDAYIPAGKKLQPIATDEWTNDGRGADAGNRQSPDPAGQDAHVSSLNRQPILLRESRKAKSFVKVEQATALIAKLEKDAEDRYKQLDQPWWSLREADIWSVYRSPLAMQIYPEVDAGPWEVLYPNKMLEALRVRGNGPRPLFDALMRGQITAHDENGVAVPAARWSGVYTPLPKYNLHVVEVMKRWPRLNVENGLDAPHVTPDGVEPSSQTRSRPKQNQVRWALREMFTKKGLDLPPSSGKDLCFSVTNFLQTHQKFKGALSPTTVRKALELERESIDR